MSFVTLKDESIVAPEILKFKGLEAKLIKLESTRENYMVPQGMAERGTVSFKSIPLGEHIVGGYGVMVSGRGFDYLRTSPVIKVLDTTSTSVTFQTEGGVYLLEALQRISDV